MKTDICVYIMNIMCYMLLLIWYLLYVTCYLLLAIRFMLYDTDYLKLAIACNKLASFRSCSATRSCFSSIQKLIGNGFLVAGLKNEKEHEYYFLDMQVWRTHLNLDQGQMWVSSEKKSCNDLYHTEFIHLRFCQAQPNHNLQLSTAECSIVRNLSFK